MRLPKKMCRGATKSHPYTSSHLGNRIEVIQSKANQIIYTPSAQCSVVKLIVISRQAN